MPIRYGWLVENTVSYNEMSGEITEDQYRRWIEAGRKQQDGAQVHRYHVMVNSKGVTKLPELKQMSQIVKMVKSDRLGLLIVIIPQDAINPVMRFATSVVSQLAGIQLKGAQDADEALEILRRLAPELEGTPFTPIDEIEWLGEID